MIKITGKNFIGSKKTSEGKNNYHSFNPKTQEKSKISFTDATKNEIDLSIKKAEECFQETRENPPKKIALYLRILSEEIMKIGDQLLDVARWETGLSLTRLKNERSRTCTQLEKFADYIETGHHLDISKETNVDIKSIKIPLGPVVVFPASNFPFAFGVCGGDTASAWAAGCPVVVKPNPVYPMTSELFAEAVIKTIKKTGFPEGFFSMLHGKDTSVSKNLVLHPKVEAVGFTGSLRAGRSIFDLAASRVKPIPVYAEMGSINPVFIVNSSGDTADELANSITLGMGQFCTKPGVIFLTDKNENIIEKVVKKLKSKNSDVLLDENLKKGLKKIVERTKKTENVELLTGGQEIKDKISFKNTVFVTDLKTYQENSNLHREHFGPVALFVKCDRFEDFFDVTNDLDGQLTCTIFMEKKDVEKVKPLFQKLSSKVGRIIINGVPTGVEVCRSMVHGGPYPATTDVRSTSVGMKAVDRFLRPVCFQNSFKELLPDLIK